MLKIKDANYREMAKKGGSSAPENGHLIPASCGYLLPGIAKAAANKARLTDNTARRAAPPLDTIIWDTELPGFGLRSRSTGVRSWIVQYRRRGRLVKETLGAAEDMAAQVARALARTRLADEALDGLPQRPPPRPASPTFADYVEHFWRDYARHWKPSTQRRNRHAIEKDLIPVFGTMALDVIARTDVIRWRDDMSARSGSFNRAIPVLAVMLAYAEQQGLRPRGSNPCRGTPRYKRRPIERFLTALEYRRLAWVLDEATDEFPASVAIIRLLLLTGARKSEIVTLRWNAVQPPRLKLADSKTGPKTIFLNRPAMAVLAAIQADPSSPFVFPGRTADEPHRSLDRDWTDLRRRAGLPDVRLHDLRHSFASIAINGGVSLTLIGGLLGHALPETTARYAHLAERSVAAAAGRVCATIASHLGGLR